VKPRDDTHKTHEDTIVISHAGAVAKYCDEHVCVCVSYVFVCLRIYLRDHTRSLYQFLCKLPMAVARSSSGGVMKSQKDKEIFGVFFPIDNALYGPYSGINFVTRDRFGLNLLIYRKAIGENSISEYYRA